MSMQLIIDVAARLMGDPACANTLFAEFDLQPDCVKLFISKGLSVGIVIGATIVKLPQIIGILRAGSARGVSLGSQLLEVVMYTGACLYNIHNGNSFGTWGEAFFQAIQALIICVLVMRFTGRTMAILALFAAYGGALALVFSGTVPQGTLTTALTALQGLSIPITVTSRALSIWQVVAEKATGELSVISSFLMLAGACARVFTTMTLVKDQLIMLSFAVGAFMNFCVLTLFFIYPKVNDKEKAAKKE